ncbi:uncharacterized protein LOC142634981 [Castanea sativa]|uniref:uncharacterized protein LOC142634981 n=1 Tax=Castanea sativa TaxID=21020 RepID=UPI003F650C10
MWNGTWSLRVAPKVKHMLRRATNEAIPTLLNLWRRNVVSSVSCPRCNSACEYTIHALWICPVLMVIWEADEISKPFEPRLCSSSMISTRLRWLPPIPLSYKVNFDGAVFKELGAAGLGVVIRDSEGLVIGALAERIPIPNFAATVEALACRRAILFAKEMSIFEATFEGDAEMITNALKNGGTNHPEFDHVIQDSLVLASAFRFCNFSHVKRLGNLVAHYLAKINPVMSYKFGSSPFLMI